MKRKYSYVHSAIDVYDIKQLPLFWDLMDNIFTVISLDNGQELYAATSGNTIILVYPDDEVAAVYYGAEKYLDEFMEVYTDLEYDDPDFEFITIRKHPDVQKDIMDIEEMLFKFLE